MKKNSVRQANGDVQAEYDFSVMKGGVRGKYYERYRRGTNVVLLDPDIAKAFSTESAVNKALRGILSATRPIRGTGSLTERAAGSTLGSRKNKRHK